MGRFIICTGGRDHSTAVLRAPTQTNISGMQEHTGQATACCKGSNDEHEETLVHRKAGQAPVTKGVAEHYPMSTPLGNVDEKLY